MKSSRRIYGQYALSKGGRVVLRPINADDLSKLLVFINNLVREKREDKETNVFTGFEEKVSRKMESEYLRDTLASIRSGRIISVAAEMHGKIVGNGEIERGAYKETQHYGRLGLTILVECRGLGIGHRMVETLLREARKKGLKRVQVEFLATNNAAVRTYQSTGFKETGRLPGKVSRNGRLVDSLIMVRRL